MENLGNLFKAHVDSGRIAAIDLLDADKPKEATYADLDASSDAVARALVARGLGRGDRIAILAQNRLEFIEVLFGALRSGCVPVPVNIKLPADTVEFILRDAGVKHMFYDRGWEARVCEDLPGTDFDEDYRAFVDPGAFEAVQVAETQVSMQLYTAGTTGRPKGVLLTHGGQGWASRALVAARRSRVYRATLSSTAATRMRSPTGCGGSPATTVSSSRRRFSIKTPWWRSRRRCCRGPLW